MPIKEQARFEDHIIHCATCQERLEETFFYIAAIKNALSQA
jgi:hypothetical protein